ncbi:MAG: HD-GYP domain-containing protein [Gemmatimonadota bacterium]
MNGSARTGPNPDAPRVLVLLSGDAREDGATRAAVLAADPAARFESDPGALLDAASRTSPDVIVWAAREPPREGHHPGEDSSGAGVPPDLLLLLGDDEAARAVAEDDRHYLRRPFPPTALRAYLEHLLGSRRREAGDRVRARLPSRTAADELYGRAVSFVGEILEAVRGSLAADLGVGRTLAEEMHTDLLHRNALVLRSLEPHSHFDLATHSVNVAVIAGKISMGVANSPEETTRVIQAGLIHDLGMARLPPALVEKAGPLTEEEWEEVRRHPVYGEEVLGEAGAPYAWMRPVVLQEHERLNGKGYPQGLRSGDIDPIALTIGVADVFEALSHPRAYRSPFTALDALEQIVGMQEDYFPRPLVEALLNEISSFPLDSFVQLSTGEIAQVVTTNPDNLMRPDVLVLWDSSWRAVPEPILRRLAAEPEVTIVRALGETELPLG